MIEINNDFIHLGILPETGGALSFLKYKKIDLLRPTVPNETEANKTALFPMLPYASFIQNGHFPYFGITRNVEKNSPFSKYPIHGDIWREQLKIKNQSENSITLTYQHEKSKGFPFSYSAEISYAINENVFEITLMLQNNSILPMPYGMGIHPFFIRNNDVKIQFEAPKIWFRGDDPILGHPYTAPQDLDFRKNKPIPTNSSNISFGSWTSKATLTYPSKNLSIEIQANNSFRHLILYAPKGKDFFCLEPVTQTPDAFNLASLGIVGTGIQSLGPKQNAIGKIEFILKGLK